MNKNIRNVSWNKEQSGLRSFSDRYDNKSSDKISNNVEIACIETRIASRDEKPSSSIRHQKNIETKLRLSIGTKKLFLIYKML